MALVLQQRPVPTGSNRPAYLDSLYAPPHPRTNSWTHSSVSSISTDSTASSPDWRTMKDTARPLSRQVEEDNSDSFSTRSKKSLFGRRKLRLGSILHRQTYPQSDGVNLERTLTNKGAPAPSSPPPRRPPPSPPSAPNDHNARNSSNRPELAKLQTNFPPPKAISTYVKRPLPAVPMPRQARPQSTRQKSNSSTAELKCQRCYYFAARNCQGYVLGGEAGDPCESCLQAGFFGAK